MFIIYTREYDGREVASGRSVVRLEGGSLAALRDPFPLFRASISVLFLLGPNRYFSRKANSARYVPISRFTVSFGIGATVPSASTTGTVLTFLLPYQINPVKIRLLYVSIF